MLRGGSFILYKSRYHSDVEKFKFSNKVCEEWNRLGDGNVSAETVNVFKANQRYNVVREIFLHLNNFS